MADVFDRNVHCLLGLPFDAVDLAGAVKRVRDAAAHSTPLFLSTPNLNWLVASQTDTAFRDSVIASDLSIADGMPLVWTARLLGVPIRERVAGSTLFDALRHGAGAPLSVFIFGGTDGVAGEACGQLNLEKKGLSCVGYESPGFGPVEEMSTDDVIRRINAARPDFLVVALGARKGQAWIEHNRPRISAPVISHLGAVVNFAAGTAVRAPAWIQRSGLEWLWRIKEEPALWRRYLADGTGFLLLLVTRVLPYSWFISRHRPTRRDLESAGIERVDHGNEIELRMRGAWVQENMHPLRECFSQEPLAGKTLRIELRHVTYVDSAVIGLLLLLHGNQKRQGKSLSLANPSERVRRILRYACAEFLLDQG